MPKASTVVIHGSQIIDGVVHRRCSHCDEIKPIDRFGLRNMRRPDGSVAIYTQAWCRTCRAAR